MPPPASFHRFAARVSVGMTRSTRMRMTSGATSHGIIAHALPRDSAKPQIALRMNRPT
jgi:hypothetical protein